MQKAVQKAVETEKRGSLACPGNKRSLGRVTI